MLFVEKVVFNLLLVDNP